MTTSQVPALIGNIIAALQGQADLTGDGTAVCDGPVVSDSAASKWVFVGFDGNFNGEFDAVTTDQTWAGLGAKRKNERIDIVCSIVFGSGSTNVQTVRQGVYDKFAVVEDVLRADPSMGLTPPAVAEIAQGALYYDQTDSGLQVRLVFTISCGARI